ncbi:MAG: hypothetical protein WC627_05225 [Legionella sp.]
MSLDEIKNILIPGYNLLTDEDRLNFEQTEPGMLFLNITHTCHEEHNKVTYLVRIVDFLTTADTNIPFNKHKESFLLRVKNYTEYRMIVDAINQKQEQQLQKYQKRQLKTFIERSKKLAELYPIIKDRTPELIEKYVNTLKDGDSSTNDSDSIFRNFYEETMDPMDKPQDNKWPKPLKTINFDPEKLEFEFLTETINAYLTKICKYLPSYLTTKELSKFNETQASLLASTIQTKLGTDKPLKEMDLLQQYKQNLLKFTHDKIVEVNQKTKKSETLHAYSFKNAISNFIWASPAVTDTTKIINQLSDTHAFLTNAGFTSQKESILFTLLEFNSLLRVKDDVTDAKTIFSRLVSPFKPLFAEFKNISKYEKNPFFIFLRTLTPLAIMVGLIVGVTVALNPLAIPEVLVAVVLIPILLYAGLGLASVYASFKNSVYNYFRELYYGGPFATPEYQINPRMLKIFKTEEKAQEIINLYINEMQKCEKIEDDFKKAHSAISLESKDIHARIENALKRETLGCEWYDIHSNAGVGTDDVPQIILNRLSAVIYQQFDQIEETWNKNDAPQMEKLIDSAVAINHPVISKKAGAPIKYSSQFFRPKALEHREFAEKLDTLARQL